MNEQFKEQKKENYWISGEEQIQLQGWKGL